jgi:membrane protein required for beta-lactamase induction
MGDVDYYLGICFDWQRESDGHISVHMSQEGYANAFINKMGLQNAVPSPKMTLYCSSLPIDSIPKQHSTISNPENKKLQSKLRSFMGMLNWLLILTRPDLTMVQHSLLASATESPTRAHLEALQQLWNSR